MGPFFGMVYWFVSVIPFSGGGRYFFSCFSFRDAGHQCDEYKVELARAAGMNRRVLKKTVP